MVLAAVFAIGCSFKKPAVEEPFPDDGRISKSFFFNYQNGKLLSSKTFICGWAAHQLAAQGVGSRISGVNGSGHCNVEFEQTSNSLIGRLVNPTYPNDKERWEVFVTIPIKKHYYLEKRKDSRGRDTVDVVENTSRSHWSARPYMNLAWENMQIKPFFIGGLSGIGIEDVEFDPENGFFGFTSTGIKENMIYRWMRLVGYYKEQAKYRYNFKAFDSNPSFKKTPFHHRNSRHLNILHIMGKMVDGVAPVHYAAHWDTSKKHDVYLHGFPDEYEQVGKDVVELWNDAFEKIGHGRPFNVKISDREYGFDLRYPTINWIDDRRLSAYAPLGVGMTIADVRTGEVQWGMVTVWGGMIDRIINAYSPVASSGDMAAVSWGDLGKPVVQLSMMEPDGLAENIKSAFPATLIPDIDLGSVKAKLNQSYQDQLNQLNQLQSELDQRVSEIETILSEDSPSAVTDDYYDFGYDPLRERMLSTPGLVGSDSAGVDPARVAQIKAQLYQELAGKKARIQEIQNSREDIVGTISSDFLEVVSELKQQSLISPKQSEIFNGDQLQKWINQPQLSESIRRSPVMGSASFYQMLQDNPNMSKSEFKESFHKIKMDELTGVKTVFDLDRTVQKSAAAMQLGLALYNVDKFKAGKSFIKDLLLHEVGHMLGLGHNFKENILPERGTVPNKYIDGDPNCSDDELDPCRQGLEAMAKDRFRNYTTVMGYKNGVTDVIMDYEELKPGPYDIHVLEYLYNKRYPMYPKDSDGSDEYVWVELKEDGLIKEEMTGESGRVLEPGYFPACNDLDASYFMDPYCKRWDRGYDAVTLVQNYYDDYKAGLFSSLYAFSDTVSGSAHWYYEYVMWVQSLSTFARTRLFYDFMRQKYDSKIKALVDSSSDGGVEYLLGFSKACNDVHQTGTTDNPGLRAFFTNPENKELLNLCVANSITMNELEGVLKLPGSDYTKIDYFNRYATASMMGGEAKSSYARAFGTWKELARTPLKVPALIVMTAPYAIMNFGGWIFPHDRYAGQDGSYHFSTLYPSEYSKAISSATEMNLVFGNSKLDDSTYIGRTVLSLGYFLRMSMFSNDILRFYTPFIENIRNQTQFRYSLSIIDVSKKDEEGKEIAKKFDATIHNMFSRGAESVPEIYLYKNDRTIIMPPPGSLLLPLRPIRWYSKSNGYYFAIKMDYSDDFYDFLKSNSVRKDLEELYYNTMKTCIEGQSRNGLRYFFNDTVDESVFPGFVFPNNIHRRKSDKDRFFISLEEQFSKYYSNSDNFFVVKPEQSYCEEAIRGQGLLVMAASVINGFYFPQVLDYIEKGSR